MQRTIIKRSEVKFAESGAVERRAPGQDSPPRCVAKKNAALVEEAGRAVAIEVTCSCGEVTIVELEFKGTPASAPAERLS